MPNAVPVVTADPTAQQITGERHLQPDSPCRRLAELSVQATSCSAPQQVGPPDLLGAEPTEKSTGRSLR